MTDTTIALFNAPDLAISRVARAGRGLIKLSLGLKAIELSAAFILMAVICVSSAYAQAPSGTLFGGNDQQLSQGVRSFIYWLRNGLFCAGIIFIAWGIINMAVREQPSFWKFAGGACAWAFAAICALVYSFSQGRTVQFDTEFN